MQDTRGLDLGTEGSHRRQRGLPALRGGHGAFFSSYDGGRRVRGCRLRWGSASVSASAHGPSPGRDRRLNCELADALPRSLIPCCFLCRMLPLNSLSSPGIRRDHPAVPRLGRGARDTRLLTVGDSGCTHNIARPLTTTATTTGCER